MIDIDQYVGTVPCTFQSLYFEDGLFALVKSISQRHENRGTTRPGCTGGLGAEAFATSSAPGGSGIPNEAREECGGS